MPKRSRAAILGLLIVTVVALAACRPPAPPPAAGTTGLTCRGNAVIGDIIGNAFAGTSVGPYMDEVIVPRESGCDPNALNRSSGAAGLFQLLGHGDLIAACPYLWRSPFDAYCNAWAARQLYNGSGLAPWAL